MADNIEAGNGAELTQRELMKKNLEAAMKNEMSQMGAEARASLAAKPLLFKMGPSLESKIKQKQKFSDGMNRSLDRVGAAKVLLDQNELEPSDATEAQDFINGFN